MATRPEPIPDLNWSADQARELGEGTIDIWTEFLATLPKRPIIKEEGIPAIRDAILRPIPAGPTPTPELLEHARSVVLEHSMYPGHPGFMAYVTGPGTVPGAAADLLAAAINQNVGGWRLSPAATEIELALGRFFAEAFGLPTETAGGYLTSGGSMANFTGLKAARDRTRPGARDAGLAGGAQLTAYAGDEIHAVSDRAVDMLGIGMDALRKIASDEAFRVRPDALERAIEADEAAGCQPFAVIGSAGTVSTGAIDDLNALADIAQRHGLWFHIDGAYGGPGIFAPDLKPLYAGIERADSIAFDPHKWLYTPHSGGCIVFRDFQHASDSFSAEPAYVHEDKELTGHGLDIGRLGAQFSRSFSAFKVWLSLLAHGRDAYAKRISHDAELARYLGELVEERPGFELTTPVSLSICCFRYRPEGVDDDEYLDHLNDRLMHAIQADGRVYCSNAVLGGRFVLRACIVNFRTEAEDVERLLDVAAELGAQLHAQLS